MKLKRFLIFLLILIILGVLAYYWPVITGKSVSSNNITKTNLDINEKESVFVDRIIDGDTIVVSGEIGNEIHVRLLGINTPEKSQIYSNYSKNFLKEIEGKSVLLERDSEDKDKYDRILGYVVYNNRIINIEILEQGLATSFMLDNLKYKEKLKNAEDFARKNGLGLWKKSDNLCSNCIILEKLDSIKEFFIIKNNCDFNCNLKEWLIKDDANHFYYLKSISSGEEEIFDFNNETKKTKSVWNDDHDRLFIRDENGNLVLFYEY